MDIGNVLDREELFSRMDDDKELLLELIELFMEDYPHLISEIECAINKNDSEKLKIAAHTLKGSVGNFCADKAVNAAAKLEANAANNDLANSREDFSKLKKQMDLVEQALQSLSEECEV